jgi:hypothetical protein
VLRAEERANDDEGEERSSHFHSFSEARLEAEEYISSKSLGKPV